MDEDLQFDLICEESATLIGNSKSILEIHERADLCISTLKIPAVILVTGESGAGKEVVARLLHEKMGIGGRFVALNSTTLSHELLESELFGNRKGAFTGASETRKGLFHQARRGTLFLDEIGDMPQELQVKLLRVLDNHTFRRVGESREEKSEIDLYIFATNRDLTHCIAEKKFREDLFYRINQYEIHIPPLRERIEDIPALIEYFCQFNTHKRSLQLSQDAMRLLCHYPWPGNVRELKTVVKRCLMENPCGTIEAEDLCRIYGALSRAKRVLSCERAALADPNQSCWELALHEESPQGLLKQLKQCTQCEVFQFHLNENLNRLPRNSFSSFILRSFSMLLDEHRAKSDLEWLESEAISFDAFKENREKQYLQLLIQKYGGNRDMLAEKLGCTRRHINRLFKKHGLKLGV